MKAQDLYEVTVTAIRPTFNFCMRAFFDRMPTVDEFIEAISHEYQENEKYRPGGTLAVLDLLSRGGLPVPPPDLAPDVGAVLSYPDGWVKITRTRRSIIDPSTGG
jgi:hypothetical protein